MCGISGFYTPFDYFTSDDLVQMTRTQTHRGPDSNGMFLNRSVGLGHNRLSIIDLSERGTQPMHSACNRYVIVYNGEVYNYAEIGAELKYKSGGELLFKSSTDTEMILEGYASIGVNVVHHLNGMFAFAIYDKQEDELLLFRDRIGIKPLYYYYDERNFAFASEIQTLKKLDKLNLKVNYNIIPQYLNLGYIPTPFSIYENCFKLEPGHYLRISKRGLEKKQYWSFGPALTETTIHNEKQAMVLVSDLIASSVQYQLKSDVPYGVFLSGGIDSSLIAANAVKLSGTTINTFSIGFENERYNEAVHARKVAQYLGTNHHEFTVTVNDAIEALDHYMQAYCEPFADSSGIPTLMVSRLAKKYVTVALSGEGGDELFHGYGSYRWAARLNNPFIWYSRAIIKRLLRLSSSQRNKRVADMFNLKNGDNIRSHIFSHEQYFFSAFETAGILSDEHIVTKSIDELLSYTDLFFKERVANAKEGRRLTPQEKQALYDLQFYLPDNLLVKMDRASMHYSLEARVPYLDHRLVEQAINIRSSLKDKPVTKYLLKEILYQSLPKEFFDRPKQGFSVPLKHWLSKEMRFLINDYLDENVIKQVGIVRPQKVKELLTRFTNGEEHLYQRLWLLITLHRWFVYNKIT